MVSAVKIQSNVLFSRTLLHIGLTDQFTQNRILVICYKTDKKYGITLNSTVLEFLCVMENPPSFDQPVISLGKLLQKSLLHLSKT